jgi:hypothetical protein
LANEKTNIEPTVVESWRHPPARNEQPLTFVVNQGNRAEMRTIKIG